MLLSLLPSHVDCRVLSIKLMPHPMSTHPGMYQNQGAQPLTLIKPHQAELFLMTFPLPSRSTAAPVHTPTAQALSTSSQSMGRDQWLSRATQLHLRLTASLTTPHNSNSMQKHLSSTQMHHSTAGRAMLLLHLSMHTTLHQLLRHQVAMHRLLQEVVRVAVSPVGMALPMLVTLSTEGRATQSIQTRLLMPLCMRPQLQ